MTKDFPLQLRRRRDSSLILTTDEFPPRHEFSQEWLVENTHDGVVSMSADEITLRFANGTATYTIDRSMMEDVDDDGNVRRLSTGYWGILASSEHFATPPVVDPEAPAADTAPNEEG